MAYGLASSPDLVTLIACGVRDHPSRARLAVDAVRCYPHVVSRDEQVAVTAACREGGGEISPGTLVRWAIPTLRCRQPVAEAATTPYRRIGTSRHGTGNGHGNGHQCDDPAYQIIATQMIGRNHMCSSPASRGG
jgi:hypothetical protein